MTSKNDYHDLPSSLSTTYPGESKIGVLPAFSLERERGERCTPVHVLSLLAIVTRPWYTVL